MATQCVGESLPGFTQAGEDGTQADSFVEATAVGLAVANEPAVKLIAYGGKAGLCTQGRGTGILAVAA